MACAENTDLLDVAVPMLKLCCCPGWNVPVHFGADLRKIDSDFSLAYLNKVEAQPC